MKRRDKQRLQVVGFGALIGAMAAGPGSRLEGGVLGAYVASVLVFEGREGVENIRAEAQR